jgi:hypothetical protein
MSEILSEHPRSVIRPGLAGLLAAGHHRARATPASAPVGAEVPRSTLNPPAGHIYRGWRRDGIMVVSGKTYYAVSL